MVPIQQPFSQVWEWTSVYYNGYTHPKANAFKDRQRLKQTDNGNTFTQVLIANILALVLSRALYKTQTKADNPQEDSGVMFREKNMDTNNKKRTSQKVLISKGLRAEQTWTIAFLRSGSVTQQQRYLLTQTRPATQVASLTRKTRITQINSSSGNRTPPLMLPVNPNRSAVSL